MCVDVVEVGYARDDELPVFDTFLEEQFAIPVACHTEVFVSVAESGGRRAREPAGDKPKMLNDRKEPRLRIGHALLDQYHGTSDRGGNDKVGTCDSQVVSAFLAARVDMQAMFTHVGERAVAQFAAKDRVLENTMACRHSHNAGCIVRCECARIVLQVHGDLVHLGRLIHRPAYEEYALTLNGAVAHGLISEGWRNISNTVMSHNTTRVKERLSNREDGIPATL